MSENSSFIKKPNKLIPRVTLHSKIMPEFNSTLASDISDTDKMQRLTKRKSCMRFKGTSIISQVPTESKLKSKSSAKTEFKSRTLQMVGRTSLAVGRTSLAPTIAASNRRRSKLPSARARPPSTPLHNSTPCEPPRSILKAAPPQRPLSAKRVNFDNIGNDEPILWDESTIATLPKMAKVPTVETADASTSTEDLAEEHRPGDAVTDQNFTKLLSRIESHIITVIDGKMTEAAARFEALAKMYLSMNFDCKTPIQGFASRLDDIEEVSENVTPAEPSSNSTQHKTNTEDGTPKAQIDAQPSNEVVLSHSPTPLDINAKDEENEEPNQEAVDEDQENVPVLPEILVIDENDKNSQVLDDVPSIIAAGRKRCTRARSQQGLSDALSPSDHLYSRSQQSLLQELPLIKENHLNDGVSPRIEGIKTRVTRKRAFPRYLSNFETHLSPKK